MPGGTLDFGESLTGCAIREVLEETGLQIRITGLIGTYTDPHILIGYSDGEVRQEFTFVYAAEIEVEAYLRPIPAHKGACTASCNPFTAMTNSS
jgi:8-oxo-dGTP pyrophosphatase MutT (NUDIX family)